MLTLNKLREPLCIFISGAEYLRRVCVKEKWCLKTQTWQCQSFASKSLTLSICFPSCSCARAETALLWATDLSIRQITPKPIHQNKELPEANARSIYFLEPTYKMCKTHELQTSMKQKVELIDEKKCIFRTGPGF